MKILVTLFLFVIINQNCVAQTSTLDKEKLLEFYQTQRYTEAAQYLQGVYPANTKDVKALTQIAYCYLMAGNLPEAEKSYLTLNEVQPNTIPVLFNLANINTRRGNDLKARNYIENVVKLDSTNFKALKQLSGLINDSLELKTFYLEKANHINLTDADVAIDLADAYKKTKKFLPAYKILSVAIKADTGNFFLLEAQLPIANELKKYAEVIEVGEKLIRNGSGSKVVKDVAKAYYFLKDYKKAIGYFQSLEKDGLQNEMTLYMTTLSYRELKELPMAISYAKKTIEEGISPNTSTYYSLLGGLLENNGKLIPAVTSYKRGLTFSENSNIYYNLGLLYDSKLKQQKSALNYYNLYLKSEPNAKTDKQQIDYVKARLVELKTATK